MPRTKRLDDEEILEEFRNTGDAFLTAAELAETLGVSRQAVNQRLKNLHEQGTLHRKEAGSRAVGWWLVED